MRIEWHITEEDRTCVRRIIDTQRDNPLVVDRRARNLASNKERVTEQRFWRTMVCMRLTTQARSGPEGKLAAFQSLQPFPLAYETILSQGSVEKFILNTLRTYGVGRHQPTIAKQLAENLDGLQQGGWQSLLDHCNRLTRLERREVEAEVADFLNDTLKGIGPKQARNILQAMGLTRYEIPIDSRITEWLNSTLRLPFRVSPVPLGDRDYYRFVTDAICELCQACGEFPCVLDAAIFASSDSAAWNVDQLIY